MAKENGISFEMLFCRTALIPALELKNKLSSKTFCMQREQEQNKAEQQATVVNRFESDTKKLVRKHLADPNHVITEEEMRNIRVGLTPPPERPLFIR